MGTYRDNEGNIRPELLDQEARERAESFYSFNEKNKKKEWLSTAQLRKFFGEFRQLQKKINNNVAIEADETKGFLKVKPLIKMIKSKAVYAANPKKSGSIPPAFKTFIIENIDIIDEKNDFDAFMLHFEAVVGFFYGIEGVKNN
ncbi:MAG: type III-A CRISPR-associated protein Csm2 [Thermodesulfobacteriota bacterium]|nr:type III-A CRISPR-associated protein Csm2 [Thermodesulfobacteriota bacterium]